MPDEPKTPKTRSPNHPSLALDKAVAKATLLYNKYHCHPAPVLSACQTMGYKSISSTSQQTIAALKAYGLADVVGAGASQKIAVSQAGERVVRGAPDREQILRRAAVAPPIHKEVLEHYNGILPHDDILKEYLVWERSEGSRFNEDAVDAFISRLRQSLMYANVTSGDNENSESQVGQLGGDSENGVDPEAGSQDLQVGSFVQWTSGGVDRFEHPRKIVGFSEDAEWAFVEGSQTGLPMSELTIVQPAGSDAAQDAKLPPTPPVNPFFQSENGRESTREESRFERHNRNSRHERRKPGADTKEDVYALATGYLVLQWPSRISPAEAADVDDWLDLMKRKLKRSVYEGEDDAEPMSEDERIDEFMGFSSSDRPSRVH